MSRRPRSWPSTIRRLLCDVVMFARLAGMPRVQLTAENLFLAEAAGALPGASGEAEAPRSGDARYSCTALTPARLALAPDSGPARHAHPVASSGLAPSVALEVAARDGRRFRRTCSDSS